MALSEIHLDIGELVLTGFPHVDPDTVVASFELELTKILHRHGVPDESDRIAVTGLPPLPATTSARRLGAELARSVHTGLSRRPR